MDDKPKPGYAEKIAAKKLTPRWLGKYILTPLNWIISAIVVLWLLVTLINYFLK